MSQEEDKKFKLSPEKRAQCRESYYRRREEISLRRKEKRKNWSEEDRKAEKDRLWRCNIKRIFGITEDEYLSMLSMQSGVCHLCGKTPEENGRRLAVDHDHESGKVRKLLCITCNVQVGTVEKNIHRIGNMLDYIRGHK